MGLTRVSRSGDPVPFNISQNIQSADSNQTLTVAMMAGGLYVRGGMTASRTDTTDTAVNILAANPNMDMGDSFAVFVSNIVAFALVFAGGVGVQIGGKTTIAASDWGVLVFTKLTATTMSVRLL